jgi:hypothetical protein
MRHFSIPDGERIRLTNRLKNPKPFPSLSPKLPPGTAKED